MPRWPRESWMAGRARTAKRTTYVSHATACAAAIVAASGFVLALGGSALAWVVPDGAPPTPACPAIPDAGDVALSADERERVDAGEIIVRRIESGDRGAVVQAVGYLDAHPVWLFDIATDSKLAPELADVLQRVDVLETRPAGKTMRGTADASNLLPSYQYTLVVSYLEDGTGQCWAQAEGDFRKNEGSHSYLWDPERGATLAVFTFELRLKGLLRLVPQSVVARLTARTLPSYMRGLEEFSARLAREDPQRAQRVEARWQALRPRLQGDELAGRVWDADRHGRTVARAHHEDAGALAQRRVADREPTTVAKRDIGTR